MSARNCNYPLLCAFLNKNQTGYTFLSHLFLFYASNQDFWVSVVS